MSDLRSTGKIIKSSERDESRYLALIIIVNIMAFLLRLARFYSDAEELLFTDPEFLQLGRLWRELNAMSNFMDTLRIHPEKVSGQCSGLSSTSSRSL